MDIRNEYLPVLLFLQPRATTPNTIHKEELRFYSNLSLTNDSLVSKNYPANGSYYSEKIIIYKFLERYDLKPTERIITAELLQYGHLEKQYRTVIDLEYLHFVNRWSYGLTDLLELGVQVSGFSFNSGIFDHTINVYHSMVGIYTGKEELPNNKFKYSLSDDRKVFLSSKPRTNLGDSVISTKWKLFNNKNSGLQFALLSSLKIPTGNKSLSMSSGKPDFSFGFAFGYNKGNWTQFLNCSAIYVSDPFKNSKVKTNHYGIVSYTLLYKWNYRFSILSQLDVHNSPYNSFTPYLNEPSLMFSMGINWKAFENSILQSGFSEDLTTYPVPDITIFLNWKMKISISSNYFSPDKI
ncbi:MAG: DUF3187 family protein [Leptospiraceae bacterium]|nr:DUF3187 family protein [Leptospiraceae bacterium]MCP5494114.1 DUF3187 family protein [Leptospiraceae bacterium]